MLRGKSRISMVWGTLLAALVLPAWGADPPTPQTPVEHHRTHKKQAPPPLVLPPLPPGPLQQVPMDKIPETAPKVTFENGRLTIFAQNATLGEILKQVRQLTGASIDLPPGGAPERVVTQIGPGAPRDVLAVLLNGSAFNYVMLGSSSDPTAIASVTLTPKPGGAEGQPNAQPQAFQQNAEAVQPSAPGGRMFPQGPFRQQMIQNSQNPPPEPAMAAGEDNADDANAEEKDDDADQPPQGQTAPNGQPEANANPQEQQGNNPNQPNAGPRTPEQILQMLRQGQQPPGSLSGQQQNNPPQQ